MPAWIFSISLLSGLVQIGLSYVAGVHLLSSPTNPHRFGYLECYNWSVVYLTVVPTILAACIPITLVLHQQSRDKPVHRRWFIALLIAALLYALITAGREAWFAQFPAQTNDHGYVEWSHLSAVDWNDLHLSPLQAVAWRALFWIGYAHYFIACFFGAVGGVGTLLYFWQVPKTKPRKLRQYEEGILFNQKVAVMCYLLFLVFLRSAKVSMSLIASGKGEQTWKVFDFFKHGEAYLDAISGGLVFDLFIGVFWLSVTLISHGLAYQVVSPHTATPTQARFLQPAFERATRAYAFFGRGARFWTGAFLFAIVLPAPGFSLLAAEAVFFATLRLMKSSLPKELTRPES